MVDHLQKPKIIPFRFKGTNLKQEWLISSPVTDSFVPTIRDEQKETLHHIMTHGIWTDVMYHKPVGEEAYIRVTYKRGKDGKKIK